MQANYAKSIEVAQDWLSSAQQANSTAEERWALEALVKTYAAMGDEAKSVTSLSRGHLQEIWEQNPSVGVLPAIFCTSVSNG